MKNEMQTVINLVEKGGEYFVSSREVAERFEKRHKNVLRDIDSMQVSESFNRLNFEPIFEPDQYGRSQRMILMSKDGFMMLAMGFTGKEAMQWKENFITAFNKMESFIKEKVPLLEQRVKELENERTTLLLESPKKHHHLKNTVIVPVSVNTIFGPDIEYRRVKKDNKHYSEISFKEGEMKRLSQCLAGMARKVDKLNKEIALLRRN